MLRRNAITGVLRCREKREEKPTFSNLVEIEIVSLVSGDGSIRLNEAIDVSLDVVEHRCVVAFCRNAIDCEKNDTRRVIPSRSHFRIMRDHASSEPYRPRLRCLRLAG